MRAEFVALVFRRTSKYLHVIHALAEFISAFSIPFAVNSFLLHSLRTEMASEVSHVATNPIWDRIEDDKMPNINESRTFFLAISYVPFAEVHSSDAMVADAKRRLMPFFSIRSRQTIIKYKIIRGSARPFVEKETNTTDSKH